MITIEDPEPKTHSDGETSDQSALLCDEKVRKAFASLLSDVDVEDVFGEFIVPAERPE